MSKTWLITRASFGLGRKLTEKLLHRGDRVIATVRRPDTLHVLAHQYEQSLHVLSLDLTDTAAIRSTILQAFSWSGPGRLIASLAMRVMGYSVLRKN